MTGLEVFAALVVITLLLGLIVALVASRRLHRGVRARVRRLIDSVPGQGPDRAGQMKAGLADDLDRLERAVEAMNARVRAQAATLDQACELAVLGTWTILPDLTAVRASSFMREIMGFSRENDIVQLDAVRERILPEDRPVFDAALKRATTERRMIHAEFRARDATGNTRIFRAQTGPGGAMPEDNQFGISGIIQDITDLRRNETELARSLTLEHLTGEVAGIGGWHYDIATRRFNGRRETAELVGLEGGFDPTVEDMTDRITDAQQREQIQRSFWTCVGAGDRFDEIARFRRFDGVVTWLRMIGAAERDQSGNTISVYGAIQDVRELVEARHATEEIRMLLETMLDALGDGFVIHDRDGEILYMNRMARNILGATDPGLVGGNIWTDLPCTPDSPLGRIVTDALETGTRQTFEGAICSPGQWVDVAVHPTSAGVAIYLQDVTERRADRARMRLLDAALSHVSDVVLISDVSAVDQDDPTVVYVNDAFERITGFAPDEIIGATPRILQGSDTERDRLEEIRQAIAGRQPIRTELTNYSKAGNRYTVEVNINPVFDAAGECTHFVSVQRDTTERRANEEHLRMREEQFRLASLASQDIIWDWDLDTGVIWNSGSPGEFQWSNRPWKPTENPEGSIVDALEHIHLDDRLKITESLNAALGGDALSWHCEYRIMGEDGAWRHISDKAFIVRNDDGTPRRMVGAMSDITDIRALDAQVHQSSKLETVGHLTGGIAHDFNNLLTIILGHCDIILDDVDEDSALRPLLQAIEDAAERGARISRDLLAFARQQPLELRTADINELIRGASALLERAIDESAAITYELTEVETFANVDPAKLEVGLLNLVINSAAAISEQGTITVRTRVKRIECDGSPSKIQPGDYVEIDVIDDGTGMSADVMEHAFEPFFTTKEPGAGTGMGLSSVYGLMKQFGGYATIQSAPGKGTTVTLGLPVAREGKPSAQKKTVPEAASRGGGERILVVEDDCDLRAFSCTALSRMGYRVAAAETGARALELLENDSDFDLIFTDVVMPGGLNGVDLARKAHQLHPGLKVLFTSGYAREALPKERHVPSDIAMLDKPFRAIELLRMVRETLARPAVLSS